MGAAIGLREREGEDIVVRSKNAPIRWPFRHAVEIRQPIFHDRLAGIGVFAAAAEAGSFAGAAARLGLARSAIDKPSPGSKRGSAFRCSCA